ncbi:hypothetical protein ES704_00074 [subsurface metagenome]|jgi:predicted nucleotidyltransferase
MNIVEIKKILEKNNNYLRQTFHVREIGIFGSFVKGEEKIDNDSDIDILITFGKGYKVRGARIHNIVKRTVVPLTL